MLVRFTVTTRYIWYAATPVRRMVEPRTRALRNHMRKGPVGRRGTQWTAKPKVLPDHEAVLGVSALNTSGRSRDVGSVLCVR